MQPRQNEGTAAAQLNRRRKRVEFHRAHATCVQQSACVHGQRRHCEKPKATKQSRPTASLRGGRRPPKQSRQASACGSRLLRCARNDAYSTSVTHHLNRKMRFRRWVTAHRSRACPRSALYLRRSGRSYCVISLHRLFLALGAAQHGHRDMYLASSAVRRRRMVAIEFGMCRSGRKGGASGSITRGNGKFREEHGAGRS